MQSVGLGIWGYTKMNATEFLSTWKERGDKQMCNLSVIAGSEDVPREIERQF